MTERVRQYRNTWRRNKYATNPEFREQCKIAARSWDTLNPDRKKELDSRWHKVNHERCRDLKRLWLANNRDRHNAKGRLWRKNNPEKQRIIEARRAGVKRAGHKTFDVKAINKIYERAAVLRKWFNVVVDHIVPIAKGGTHCASNLQILYATENRYKSDSMTYKPSVIFA